MTLAIGIIGVGVMGADHARTLSSQIAGAKLRALTDADTARAKAVAAETGAETIAADPLALIHDPSVDAVIIASPDATHHPLTLACIKAGKPVLCEKPLAPTAAQCLEIVAAEVKAGRHLVQVGYMRRFDPAYVEMKAKSLSGELGKALMFHCIHRNLSAPPWFDSNMAITNSVVHEIDIMRWLLETELTSVQVMKPATAIPDAPGGPVFAIFQTAAGQIVSVENNNNGGYGYDVRGELVCEKGTVSLRSPVNSEVNSSLMNSTGYPLDWRPRFAAAYRLQMQAWVRSIAAGKTPGGSNAWDGYAASAIAEAGLRALADGKTTPIKLEAKPAFYA